MYDMVEMYNIYIIINNLVVVVVVVCCSHVVEW